MNVVDAPGAFDIVGTGGDGAHLFNISTTASFVLAGAGICIAKHGNRAASSKCGSADVLEALGVNITLTPTAAAQVYNEAGIVFLFAPLFHPTVKNVGAIRKALQIRTLFNLIGPFSNPAQTQFQLIGVPSATSLTTLAPVAQKLGYTRVLIVHSRDGLDEVSTSAPTDAILVVKKKMTRLTIDPQKIGFTKPKKGSLAGGDASVNASITRAILAGEKGPRRDIVLINAAAALFAAGVTRTIKEGVLVAEESIDCGRAQNALTSLISASQKHNTL
jgi:anthranilate phosphoribosyltransferase